jgi:RNA polymerase-associated protein LEO1
VGIDGHIYLLKVPHTLSMEPVIFDPEKFTMPTTDPDSDVSAYTHATNSIRVRKDPRNPSKLQSNARIIRWSDGTLSLQIASSSQIYDLAPKPLTSDPKRPDKYQPTEDSHTYLLDPHESAGTLRVIGHATQALTVVPAGGNLANNRAVQRLHSELAIAINSSGRKNPLEMTDLKDPEAERKEAERIAKEKERANKKLEAQRRRAKERDPLEGAARRSYQRVTGTRSKRDSPPITAGRGRGREDEYDLEDEFIEGSDDEIDEEASDGANEDDEMDEKRPKRETERDRKRRRVVDESDEE